MLRHLSIRNFVLVDVLDLELDPGFAALTGETGAGKSILLDALGLLLGDRRESRPAEASARVVAPVFNPLLLGPLAKYRAVRADLPWVRSLASP